MPGIERALLLLYHSIMGLQLGIQNKIQFKVRGDLVRRCTAPRSMNALIGHSRRVTLEVCTMFEFMRSEEDGSRSHARAYLPHSHHTGLTTAEGLTNQRIYNIFLLSSDAVRDQRACSSSVSCTYSIPLPIVLSY